MNLEEEVEGLEEVREWWEIFWEMVEKEVRGWEGVGLESFLDWLSVGKEREVIVVIGRKEERDRERESCVIGIWVEERMVWLW